MIKYSYMRFLKQVIAIVFLFSSIWLGYLIFENEFSNPTVIYDTKYELEDSTINGFTKLIRGTVFSGVGILFMGLLALFSNFVFTKLLFKDDIKQTAIKHINEKRKKIHKLIKKDKDYAKKQEQKEPQ